MFGYVLGKSDHPLSVIHKMWLNPHGGESEYHSHTIGHKVMMRIALENVCHLLSVDHE